MGCLVEVTDTGVEVEIHRFDTRTAAALYLTTSRGYVFDRNDARDQQTISFAQGPEAHLRASLRPKTDARDGHTFWSVAFWSTAGKWDGRVIPVGGSIKDILLAPEYDRGGDRAATLFLTGGPTINIWFAPSGRIVSAHFADGSREKFALGNDRGRTIQLDLHDWLLKNVWDGRRP